MTSPTMLSGGRPRVSVAVLWLAELDGLALLESCPPGWQAGFSGGSVTASGSEFAFRLGRLGRRRLARAPILFAIGQAETRAEDQGGESEAHLACLRPAGRGGNQHQVTPYERQRFGLDGVARNLSQIWYWQGFETFRKSWRRRIVGVAGLAEKSVGASEALLNTVPA
jgi:hypothetical protein